MGEVKRGDMTHTETVWQGDAPMCDFCAARLVEREAKYDGKTDMGPWALMCENHFQVVGVGLGLGRGQKLVVKP